MRKSRPEIGAKMYSVHEHMYYIPGNVAPLKEYCVCEAKVVGFCEGGYTEVRLKGLSPSGFQTPYEYKLSDVGKCLFYTVREAALLAKSKTERYEYIWGQIGASDIPMRRPWENLLCENNEVYEQIKFNF